MIAAACRFLLFVALVALVGCDRAPDETLPEPPPSSDCTGLDAARCIEEDIALEQGDAGPADPAGALDLYLQTCDGGDDARGCTLAANLLVESEAARALALYERACEANDPWGCFHAGNAYGVGELDTPKNPVRAHTYLQRACDHGGPPQACEFAAVVEKIVDMPSAAEREARCKAGEVGACRDLGLDLRHGRHGLDAEPNKALDILMVGCQANDGGSCAMAGMMLEKGEAGRSAGIDKTAVDRLYSKACEAGFMMGCRALGRHLLTGSLLPRDADRGVPLLERACNASSGADLESCTWLGVAYEKGLGVQANVRRAFELYTRACDEGRHDLACEILADAGQPEPEPAAP